MAKHLRILILIFLALTSCKQKEISSNIPKTTSKSENDVKIVEEKYIQDDSLAAKFFYELNEFKKDSRFIIQKELIKNRHVDNVIDTVINFEFDKIKISSYKTQTEEFIFEANIKNPEFQFSKNIKIGIKKKDFENSLNTKINSNVIKVGDLEQTSVFVFNFKKDILTEIVYEGYLD
ncbi:hypothetical protein [Flavobacterium sp. DG2-3]|uniref:hypothetical protein n=1 Tax=Flavobacterium sp. DG2-3 TaxID=3068317 RepID=UPI00273FE787|nr:hypothetical protein [Flavobacterium sp. DG2-3]MDP5198829.1 hypothetical protein [Flavobacterium sp. DG2-3]